MWGKIWNILVYSQGTFLISQGNILISQGITFRCGLSRDLVEKT